MGNMKPTVSHDLNNSTTKTEEAAESSVTIDGNEACASIAFRCSEVIAIYPITPSSPMGEHSDTWSARGEKNIWGGVPTVIEMQSEGGAAGTVHGALQAGSLTTTFTASQGLLLMIPNMYKIAGELTPTVFHVAARSVAAQALSIFADHSDVMATRQTGFAMLASASVQEAADMALIAQASTMESRLPFIHFFDGFRTSHEVMKISLPGEPVIRQMLDDKRLLEVWSRGLTPDNPRIRGTAQNPDVFFQARETVNSFYRHAPDIVQKHMNRFAEITGRSYHLFDYTGDPKAKTVLVIMGSGGETASATVEHLCEEKNEVGVLQVRLYRPFASEVFVSSLPKSVETVIVLDRTKEPGSTGEPLFQDCVLALQGHIQNGGKHIASMPAMYGGRYGLSSKEFTPSMVKSIFDAAKSKTLQREFTVGINDDVTGLSLEYDPVWNLEDQSSFRGLFFGLGSDGTVSANKNSIKIIGQKTRNNAQGYFVYDSKKSGSMTVSHLRFGEKPVQLACLIEKANFIAVHKFNFFEKMDVLEKAEEGATLLLNTPVSVDKTWEILPEFVRAQIIQKKMKVFAINADEVAQSTGMGRIISTIMQVAFFKISGILPEDQAIEEIKSAVQKTYGKRSEEIVKRNYRAIEATLEALSQIDISESTGTKKETSHFDPLARFDIRRIINERKMIPGDDQHDFIENVTLPLIAGQGEKLPVSAFHVDGTFPTGTTRYEKRAIASEIPVWDPDTCIQCAKCVIVCPHGVIRIKAYESERLSDAPEGFKSTDIKDKNLSQVPAFTIQVSPEDCTGCTICVEVCPAKNKSATGKKAINMEKIGPLLEAEKKNWEFFQSLPELDRSTVKHNTVKGSQFLEPLFEFSGACAGCGETPYLKLVTQLFGDRMLIANATGCSSIYGGNLPTTPYTVNREGKGPAWANSLFEDNAEFGLGFRLSLDKKEEEARRLLEDVHLQYNLPVNLHKEILDSAQEDEAEIYEQRKKVAHLKEVLQTLIAQNETANVDEGNVKRLLQLADYLVKKSVWIIGGDGWAYDIGYGGLDHVLASGRNVNILVLDTEVYSNTGGQKSKSTPMAAVAKFAAAGKSQSKKDLGLLAMGYENVYVAKVAMGANDTHTIKAFLEAERHEGPSLILAYSHCIAHGYNLRYGMKQQKLAVNSGYWPLYRFNPLLAEAGENPLQLDSQEPDIELKDFIYNETRFSMLTKIDPKRARTLLVQAQDEIDKTWQHYRGMAGLDYEKPHKTHRYDSTESEKKGNGTVE